MSNPNKREKKYKKLSIDEKPKIIRRLEAGEKNKDFAMEYGVGHSAISYIFQQKENFKCHILNYSMLSKKIGRKRGWTQSRILS